jgi:hypothetical protein
MLDFLNINLCSDKDLEKYRGESDIWRVYGSIDRSFS